MPKQPFLRISRDNGRLCITGMTFKIREDLKALRMKWRPNIGWVYSFTDDQDADSVVAKLRGIAARKEFKLHALNSTISACDVCLTLSRCLIVPLRRTFFKYISISADSALHPIVVCLSFSLQKRQLQ